MTAGSTMPFRSMERGLMGRLGSSRCCCTMLFILSLVSCMVSMAFSRGLISTCGEGRRWDPRPAAVSTPPGSSAVSLAREVLPEDEHSQGGPGFLFLHHTFLPGVGAVSGLSVITQQEQLGISASLCIASRHGPRTQIPKR